MNWLSRVALLVALSGCSAAPAVASATCWPGGGFSLSYGLLSPPTVSEGALIWEHDTNSTLTSTLPCLLAYDAEPAEFAPAAQSYSILCYADGYLIYSGAGHSIALQDGVWTWTETATGDLYAATVGCYAVDWTAEAGKG